MCQSTISPYSFGRVAKDLENRLKPSKIGLMSDVVLSKKCCKCSRHLPLSEYHLKRESPDGHQTKCQSCVRQYRAEYYQKNQERLRQYSLDFYKQNADDVKAYQKEYAQRFPDRIRERNKQWLLTVDRNAFLEQKRQWHRANRDRMSQLQKAYRAVHPEYARISCHKRKARLKQAAGTCSRTQFLAKIEYHGWRCYLCNTSLTIKELHMDHRTPIARGGSNWPANLAPACGPCNLSKGRKTESEYRTTLSACFSSSTPSNR